jgi:aminopeptidase
VFGAEVQKKIRPSLTTALQLAEKKKVGDCVVVYNTEEGLDSDVPRRIAVVCVGGRETNDANVRREDLRVAAAVGVSALAGSGASQITVDPSDHCTVSVAEGASLALYRTDNWTSKKEKKQVDVTLSVDHLSDDAKAKARNDWDLGLITATAQKFARTLMETPPNDLGPSEFVNSVTAHLSQFSDVKVVARDKNWIVEQGMGGIIGVSQGSAKEPKLLEITFSPNGATTQPICLIGKGVTFDSGGISLKPAPGMGMMKGDMGGAAVVASVVYGAAMQHKHLSAIQGASVPPYHLKVFIPLVENMPSGTATRPGDVLRMFNGKTVEVDNTDAEGRLILGDALAYAQKVCENECGGASVIVDVATLTGAMDVALGQLYTGVFSTHDDVWNVLNSAGQRAGEWVWRMPLAAQYLKTLKSNVADVKNSGKRSAGACTAAIFLNEFVTQPMRWMHLDIAGTMHSDAKRGYLPAGMTGVSVRALLDFVQSVTLTPLDSLKK